MRVHGILLVAGVALTTGVSEAQTVTLDFSGAPVFVSPLPWNEDGFTIDDVDPGAYVYAVGAQEHLVVASDGSGAVRARLTPDGGGPFDVLAVDVLYANTLVMFGTGEFHLESDLGSRRILAADKGTTLQLSGPAWTGIQYLDLVYVGDAPSQDHDMGLDNFVLRQPSAVPLGGGPWLALLALGLAVAGARGSRRWSHPRSP